MAIPKRKSWQAFAAFRGNQTASTLRPSTRTGSSERILLATSPRGYLLLAWGPRTSRRPLPAGSSGGRYSGTFASMFA